MPFLSRRGDRVNVLFDEAGLGDWYFGVWERYGRADFPGDGEAVAGDGWVWLDGTGDWVRAGVWLCGGEFGVEDEGAAEEDGGHCRVGCL